MTAPKEVKRTLKGLLLEMNLEKQYEVKKACEDQLLNMHDDLKSQLTAAQDEITLLKSQLKEHEDKGLAIYGRKIEVLNGTVRVLEAKLEKATEFSISGYKIVKTFDEPRAWAIRTSSFRVSRSKVVDYEPRPSERTDEYIAEHTFTLDEAFKTVEEMLSTITIDSIKRGEK